MTFNAFQNYRRDTIIDMTPSPKEELIMFADRNIDGILALEGAGDASFFANWQETIKFLIALQRQDSELMAQAAGLKPEDFEALAPGEILEIVCARAEERGTSCEQLIQILGEYSEFFMHKYFTPEYYGESNVGAEG
jgi:hypothetical protein